VSLGQVASTDVKQIAALAASSFDLRLVLPDEYRYSELGLCVLDAVFSIGIRYTAVRAVVHRYASFYGLSITRQSLTDQSDLQTYPSRAAQEPVSTLIERIEGVGPERFSTEVVRNRCRTSSRGGILKSDASLRFARILAASGVEYFQDVSKVLTSASFDAQVRAIPGQRSGISLRYFFMLAGSEDRIKPDRHIIRFLSTALHRPVVIEEAEPLLRAVAGELAQNHPNLNLRTLDYCVWDWQRKQKWGV
jgi:hypothetical protein